MGKSKTALEFVHQAELGSKGLVVAHKKDDKTVGHLHIGRASLVWFEGNGKKKGFKVSWAEFREWLRTHNEVKASRPG